MTPKQFKTIRIDLGFTQARLALLLGKDPRSIRHYEKGEHFIPVCVALLMELFAGLKTIKDCLNGK